MIRNYRTIAKQNNNISLGMGAGEKKVEKILYNTNINEIILDSFYSTILSVTEFSISGKCDMEITFSVTGISSQNTTLEIYIGNGATQISSIIKQDILNNETVSFSINFGQFNLLSRSINIFARVLSGSFTIPIIGSNLRVKFTNYVEALQPVVGPEIVNDDLQLALLLNRYFKSWAIIEGSYSGSSFRRWIGSLESDAVFSVGSTKGLITSSKPFKTRSVNSYPYSVNLLTTSTTQPGTTVSFGGTAQKVIYTNTIVNGL